MLTLQPATLSDWQEIGAIESNSGNACYKALTLEGELKEFLTESRVFFAINNGKKIGSVGIKQLSDKQAQLVNLSIMPEYRGQGYGKELVEVTVQEATRLGFETIMLLVHPTNTTAQIMYLKCGFIVTAYKENYFGDGEPRLVMEREIVNE